MLKTETRFETFDKALDAVLAHLNFPNEWPEATVMPDCISQANRAARSDLADAWEARERARKLQRPKDSAYIKAHSACVHRTHDELLICSTIELNFRVAEARVKLLNEILGEEAN